MSRQSFAENSSGALTGTFPFAAMTSLTGNVISSAPPGLGTAYYVSTSILVLPVGSLVSAWIFVRMTMKKGSPAGSVGSCGPPQDRAPLQRGYRGPAPRLTAAGCACRAAVWHPVRRLAVKGGSR
jgi:hypothetical protein